MPEPLSCEAFSHITVRVTDMERSKAFYADVLGLEPVFDIELSGGGLDELTGKEGNAGRMAGFLVPGGVMIELLCFPGQDPTRPPRQAVGYGNISLGVRDLQAAYDQLVELGVKPVQKPVEVGGVEMFFIADPDGTSIELIQFPGDGVFSSAGYHGRA